MPIRAARRGLLVPRRWSEPCSAEGLFCFYRLLLLPTLGLFYYACLLGMYLGLVCQA